MAPSIAAPLAKFRVTVCWAEAIPILTPGLVFWVMVSHTAGADTLFSSVSVQGSTNKLELLCYFDAWVVWY